MMGAHLSVGKRETWIGFSFSIATRLLGFEEPSAVLLRFLALSILSAMLL